MQYLIRAIVICLVTTLVSSGCSAAPTQNTNLKTPIELAKNGHSQYVIVLAADAIPSEKMAADELQKYLQEITGTTFPIQSETEVNINAPQILVGSGTKAKVLLPHQNWNSLGSDGIVIKTVGNNLILAGGRPRGTLYAVFQFLEDSAGCRWWTPTESYIPHKSTFEIASQNITYVPPFNYREHYTTEIRTNPLFAAIMHENGPQLLQTPDWYNPSNVLGGVHTFSKLLPPEKYFQEHPEWYSDPANNNLPCTAASKMPAAQSTQLCLSDPQMLDELTKNALEWIKQNPSAGYISISQNDNQNYCRDAESMKLAETEGSQMAPVLNFVNKVATKIHQQYPDFKVMTLAYQYTEKPPKTIRPAKNVVIRLAPIESDFGHPLNSNWNQETRDNLLAWSKIAPEIFVWNYVSNFSSNMFPHPDWLGLAPDLRFFAANHVKGIFEQGDAYTNGVGDFVQLRAWLMGKLMWNPQLDQEKLTDEFLQGYYGAAAPYLKQYLDLIQQSFLAQNKKLSTFNKDFSFLTLDVTNQSIGLFQQAENAVKDNKVLLDRVRREQLSLDIATLFRYDTLKHAAADQGKEFLGPKDPRAAMTEFIKTAQAFGIKRWTEAASFEAMLPHLENMFSPQVPLPDFAQKYPASDVIDIQQNKYSLYKQGTLSDITDDPLASDGKAAYVVGNTKEWAISMFPTNSMQLGATPEKWHAYAMARVNTKADMPLTGIGFASGVYDSSNKKAISEITIPLAKVTGENYQQIDLGSYLLKSGMIIWIAPRDNPVVEKVYIDRIILIRE